MTSVALSALLAVYFMGAVVVFSGLLLWHHKEDRGDFDPSAALFTGIVWPIAAILLLIEGTKR